MQEVGLTLKTEKKKKKKVKVLIYLMPTQFQKSIAFGGFPGFAVSPSGEKNM